MKKASTPQYQVIERPARSSPFILLAAVAVLVAASITVGYVLVQDETPQPRTGTALGTFSEVNCSADIANRAPAFGATMLLVANASSRTFFQMAVGNFSRVPGYQRPAAVDDLFIIQSVTKMIVNAAILAMGVDRDAFVVDLCGETRCGMPGEFVDAFLPNVTVKELMLHVSGMPDHESNEDCTNVTAVEVDGIVLEANPVVIEAVLSPTPISTYQLLQIVADNYLYNASRPRKYSNTGYVVLAMLLEHVTGKHWEDAIDAFFGAHVPNDGETPCSTRYHRNFTANAPVENVISGYKRLDHNDLLVWDHVRHDSSLHMNSLIDQRFYSNIVGQGGMVCSLRSLANFMLALREGRFPNVRDDDFAYYQMDTLRGHAGGTGAMALLDPARDLVLVATSSSELSGSFCSDCVLKDDPRRVLDCLA